ncbi:DUF5686 family protein [Marinilabilia sp.]|uniref:DUF5686 family protein n=1 Tax=Marinilabilia sp. TaxID=2021252 RepID=UPI0025BA044E|nr:DUF5686 family protein [Marinilabilia sp.]
MYRHIKNVILILFLIWGFAIPAHSQTEGTLTDAKTETPIPFANIVFQDGKSGTITNLKGEFIIPADAGDSVLVSCIGYHPAFFNTSPNDTPKQFRLEPQTIELQGIDVYPGENPALNIMQKVLENSSKNNPDLASDYSCIVYHKMAFSLDIADSISVPDSLEQKFIDFNRNNHMLLMESVSEKKHMVPDKTTEKIISGRVSGFQDPALAILPGLIQPFGFYSPQIELMGIEHLNPISKSGLKNYFFLLNDTIIENGDSLFYITYQPRKKSNIKPLTGSFHIHKKTYGIRYLKAKSDLPSSPYITDISQSYKQTDSQWFPSELKSQLIIKPGEGFNSLPYAMVGDAKSIVTAINLNPTLSPKDFSNVVLEDKMPRDTGHIKILRYEPLTAKDSSTYHLLDSLGRANNLDKIIRLQKNLIRGYIPAGSFRLELQHLVNYNQFEGLKLGLGLWTGPEITENFSLGGYFTHAFNTEKNNYGGGIKWRPQKNSQALIDLIYSHDMHSTGIFNFYHGNRLSLNQQLEEISVAIKDREEKFYIGVGTKLRGPVSGKIFFTRSDVTPVRLYPFIPLSVSPEAPFQTIEAGIKLRWVPNEQMTSTAFGLLPEPSDGPKIWLNIIRGTEQQNGHNNSFTKLEGQIEKTFRTGPSAKTKLRFTGGLIEGWAISSNLYSYFGTFAPVSIEVPTLFATMAPNEFAADRFAMATLDHRIALRQNRPGTFKPEINFSTKAGWGVVEADYLLPVTSFEKGFYESGILFDNLLKVLFIKYGLGVHYRYGPYQKEKDIDNWSFRMSISFSL